MWRASAAFAKRQFNRIYHFRTGIQFLSFSTRFKSPVRQSQIDIGCDAPTFPVGEEL
jgi:hypothetical protein